MILGLHYYYPLLHFSYVAATFVIEALSVANAVLSKKRRVEYDDVVVADGPSTFEIAKKVEVVCFFIDHQNI